MKCFNLFEKSLLNKSLIKLFTETYYYYNFLLPIFFIRMYKFIVN